MMIDRAVSTLASTFTTVMPARNRCTVEAEFPTGDGGDKAERYELDDEADHRLPKPPSFICHPATPAPVLPAPRAAGPTVPSGRKSGGRDHAFALA